jgi:flagellar motor protein MotB
MNWDISARRAQEVLKFYYNCEDCGYPQEKIRTLLILSGEGDTSSEKSGQANSRERRVDVILDFNEKQED